VVAKEPACYMSTVDNACHTTTLYGRITVVATDIAIIQGYHEGYQDALRVAYDLIVFQRPFGQNLSSCLFILLFLFRASRTITPFIILHGPSTYIRRAFGRLSPDCKVNTAPMPPLRVLALVTSECTHSRPLRLHLFFIKSFLHAYSPFSVTHMS
jgi:hypothetical protein